jgi:hypothetical protein
VIGDVNIFHSTRFLLLEGCLKVVLHFSLVGALHFRVLSVGEELNSLAHFDVLKPDTCVPLIEILLKFVLLKEGWCHQFLSPERNMRLAAGKQRIASILIDNTHLIHGSELEGPDLVFFEAVINGRVQLLGRVGVERFSVDVVINKLFISVFHGNGVCNAYNILIIGLERLQTLELVLLVQTNVIHIRQLRGIIHYVFVEPSERVIQRRCSLITTNDFFHADVHTIIDLEIFVLIMTGFFIVDARRGEGTAKSLILSVPMDSP